MPKHQTVNHGRGEYVRGEVHTNTVEGFFSLLKRGINGIVPPRQQGPPAPLLREFAFRYENRKASDGVDDGARMLIVQGAEGKRLTYKQPAAASAILS